MTRGRSGLPGMLGTITRGDVVKGTASMTVSVINNHARRLAPVQTAYTAPKAYAVQGGTPPDRAPASSTGPGDVVSRLAQLAQLRDDGVLTEGEFNSAKAILLHST